MMWHHNHDEKYTDKRHHPEQKGDSEQPNHRQNNDPYGVFKQGIEVDTDVNEDSNRERLLDESLDTFIKQDVNKEKY